MENENVHVIETVHPSEILRKHGKETTVVKCPAGHILFSCYTGRPLPSGFRIIQRCKSCRKYYEIAFG